VEREDYFFGVLTDEGMRALSSCTALSTLDLGCCELVTDVGVKAVSSLPALKSLNLCGCKKVTDVGLRAVSSCTGSTAAKR
jgi:F-box/leucine-rich repeat protein 14